ncbi:MAG: hypothetical protein AAFZ15_03335 [Bacteroidota bacterium]
MKRIKYKCTLLTDVVINSTNATEGFRASLDYIPGAKFLGIVASQIYDLNKPEQTLDLFHNGRVRFGDAHPILNSEHLYWVPFVWHFPKGGRKKTPYQYHLIDLDDRKGFIEEEVQLEGPKKFRYLSNDLEGYKPKQNFSIKSAYDEKEYRAKDGQMYGYFGLEKGTEWGFTLEVDDEKYVDLLNDKLVGKRRVGRSKSAEYGLVEIEKVGEIESEQTNAKEGIAFLYAASNWCFYDQAGRCTLTPTPEQLILPPNSTINWKKSQLRSHAYRTWNQHRQNRDANRQVIQKGSVIVVELGEPINDHRYDKGIGAHRAEGFGKVLLNPSFLMNKHKVLDFNFENQQLPVKASHYLQPNGANDQLVLDYLALRHRNLDKTYNIEKLVNNFISENFELFKGITSSQWGQIRRYAKGMQRVEDFEELVFKEESGFLYMGKSQGAWRENDRRTKLKDYLFTSGKVPKGSILEFTMKLSSELAKAANSITNHESLTE